MRALAPLLLLSLALVSCSCTTLPPAPRVVLAPGPLGGAPRDGTVVRIAVAGGPREVAAVRFTPPAIYGVWGEEAARCSGMPLARAVPVASLVWLEFTDAVATAPGWRLAGYWLKAAPGQPDTILVYRGDRREAWVVIHELLHHLRREGGHPAQPFETCGVLDNHAWERRQALAPSLREMP